MHNQHIVIGRDSLKEGFRLAFTEFIVDLVDQTKGLRNVCPGYDNAVLVLISGLFFFSPAGCSWKRASGSHDV